MDTDHQPDATPAGPDRNEPGAASAPAGDDAPAGQEATPGQGNPPGEDTRPQRGIPALAIVLVCVLALIGGVWWAGGFAAATNRLFRLPVATEVDLGPLSFSVDRAVAKQGYGRWSLYVFAHCRNNTDEPLVSTEDRWVRNGFSVQHPVDKVVADDGSMFFGPGETLGNSDVLNPGTPMVPCQLVFTFDDFPATDFVSVGASELEWIDASPTGEGEMVWSAARIGYRFEVPVVTEPEQP